MTDFPSQETIVATILKGITKAKENFLFWTNERLFLSYGPQKIITIHIAQALGEMKNAPEVFIDATVADILRCSLPDRKAYTQYMQNNALAQGVFNITLDERFPHKNDNDSVSRVIVTVKNGVRGAKPEFSNEIERLCKMLDRDASQETTLDFGVFAFYADLSDGARKKLDKRLPEILASFDVVVKRFPSLKAHYKETGIQKVEGVGEWCALCYVIEPK